ncbi:MAG: transporter substrate-binding domain-containing protein [Myxococcales bacterium]|nr:transporter substrate-binding domain-containing protein [Myxococcales bacterium]
MSTAILGVTAVLSSLASPSADASFLDLESSLMRHTREQYAADLEGIRRRGVLRVLTLNNSSSYFITRGTQRGFEYELAEAFAKELGVRLAIVVPTSRGSLIEELLAGNGDLIAAGMTKTEARAEKVRFTRPLLSSPRVSRRIREP